MPCRALRLDQFGVKMARRHKLLEGKKPIARGAFSAVFEGRRKNTVLKMTVDDIGYFLFNDACAKVEHWHFPRVVENYFCIGDTIINGVEYPIYLYEMERLEKLKRSSDAGWLAALLTNASGKASASVSVGWRHEQYIVQTLTGMLQDDRLPRSIHNALRMLLKFSQDVPGGTLDLHNANLMQRANGELVLADPIANMKIWDAAHQQVRVRGW